ncbi:uncharacterized protein PITG_02243 [Phytophthora infestans T30-4]|uniref:Uncharacterized protein n=1 Tax=Phytophthora infestans (strain T30-4) TaxID=403677 RepID=D0MVU4_PHYIT|nr:uncharacterized protein PITG_02243 [Phytophthora infestans T30-4]EEY63757.1 hypothetical protein PITG_02243 [Phytophthora infestans T30-4]|eukprot:XP_002907193.1 hypothetical protein PITG_02243 [Phytophthora infestans T30-4]
MASSDPRGDDIMAAKRPSFQSKPRYRQLVDDLSGTLSPVVKTASADSLDYSDGVYPYAITSGPEASNWFEIRDKKGDTDNIAPRTRREGLTRIGNDCRNRERIWLK